MTAVLPQPTPSVAPPGQPAAAPSPALLAAVDILAVAVLALVGAGLVGEAERFWLLPAWSAPLALAPFALLGPLGVGVERGRTGAVPFAVAAAVALGAGLGALAGALAFLGLEAPWTVLAARVLPPLLLGAPLARLGTAWARPEEPWREAARRGPPEATPALARKIAHAPLPLALRVLLAPLALATVPLALALVVLIRVYQITASRLMPPACRFEPSCSRYGFEALRRHGLVRGVVLTAFRVGRCQPFCEGGHDPVPEALP